MITTATVTDISEVDNALDCFPLLLLLIGVVGFDPVKVGKLMVTLGLLEDISTLFLSRTDILLNILVKFPDNTA